MLKLSEAASLALHTMRVLATVNGERRLTTKGIASRLGVSEAHLSKVLQRLARRGLVSSTRGPKGGFKLSKASGEIAMIDVFEAIEGPLKSERCFLGNDSCPEGECMFGGLIETVNRLARSHLENTTLRDLANGRVRG